MQAYLGNQPVSLTIPLVGPDGVEIVATAASYRVIDEAEVELVAKTSLASFIEGDTSVVVTVSALLNAVPVGAVRAMRVVEVYLTTEAGTIKIESAYIVESEETIVEGVNSFQGYFAALNRSYDIPNLLGWSAADKRARSAALVTARRNIALLKFRYDLDDPQSYLEGSLTLGDISALTPTQWAALPALFKEAICRAQILEADNLLGGDEIGDIRRAGLMSMTVGEAKQFFRPSKSLESAVCKRAMKELSRYIMTAKRIGRA